MVAEVAIFYHRLRARMLYNCKYFVIAFLQKKDENSAIDISSLEKYQDGAQLSVRTEDRVVKWSTIVMINI